MSATKSSCLLLGDEKDPHLVRLAQAVSARGVEPVVQHSRSLFPVTLDVLRAERSTLLNRPLSDYCGAFIQRLPPRQRAPAHGGRVAVSDLIAGQVEADAWRDTAYSTLTALETLGAQVINPPGPSLLFTPKLEVLRAASALELAVPETVVTSVAAEARYFIDAAGETVAKPVRGGAHAALVIVGDERVGRVSRAPVAFQQRVWGADVRVVMLDGRVLSAARLGGLVGDVVDFRQDPAYRAGRTRYTAFALPAEVEARLATLAVRFGVRFCGFDLKDAESGPVFLEMNLAPRYLEQEDALGHDISRPLAAALTAKL